MYHVILEIERIMTTIFRTGFLKNVLKTCMVWLASTSLKKHEVCCAANKYLSNFQRQDFIDVAAVSVFHNQFVKDLVLQLFKNFKRFFWIWLWVQQKFSSLAWARRLKKIQKLFYNLSTQLITTIRNDIIELKKVILALCCCRATKRTKDVLTFVSKFWR